jgi:hypothetical protein
LEILDLGGVTFQSRLVRKDFVHLRLVLHDFGGARELDIAIDFTLNKRCKKYANEGGERAQNMYIKIKERKTVVDCVLYLLHY